MYGLYVFVKQASGPYDTSKKRIWYGVPLQKISRLEDHSHVISELFLWKNVVVSS